MDDGLVTMPQMMVLMTAMMVVIAILSNTEAFRIQSEGGLPVNTSELFSKYIVIGNSSEKPTSQQHFKVVFEVCKPKKILSTEAQNHVATRAEWHANWATVFQPAQTLHKNKLRNVPSKIHGACFTQPRKFEILQIG